MENFKLCTLRVSKVKRSDKGDFSSVIKYRIILTTITKKTQKLGIAVNKKVECRVGRYKRYSDRIVVIPPM